MNKYVLDKDFNLKKVTRSVWGILWTCLKWIVATVSLAAFSYLIFHLCSIPKRKKAETGEQDV